MCLDTVAATVLTWSGTRLDVSRCNDSDCGVSYFVWNSPRCVAMQWQQLWWFLPGIGLGQVYLDEAKAGVRVLVHGGHVLKQLLSTTALVHSLDLRLLELTADRLPYL